VSEWIGWVSRVRRMLYSRMEELSFRTGAATVAGVMAVAATAILLTLTQGGHRAGPPRAQAGLAPSSFVAAPAVVPTAPSATHRSHPRRSQAAPNISYVPAPAKSPTATPQPSPSPRRPTPRYTYWTNPPVTHRTPNPAPSFPFPWPTAPNWP
jgi:hypothetical protein